MTTSGYCLSYRMCLIFCESVCYLDHRLPNFMVKWCTVSLAGLLTPLLSFWFLLSLTLISSFYPRRAPPSLFHPLVQFVNWSYMQKVSWNWKPLGVSESPILPSRSSPSTILVFCVTASGSISLPHLPPLVCTRKNETGDRDVCWCNLAHNWSDILASSHGASLEHIDLCSTSTTAAGLRNLFARLPGNCILFCLWHHSYPLSVLSDASRHVSQAEWHTWK